MFLNIAILSLCLLAGAPLQGRQRGKLHVASDPAATVFEGGRRLGNTPLDLVLDVGIHDLRLVNTKLFMDVKQRVQVSAEQPKSIILELGIAKLKIEAPDGTVVTIDKKVVGTTPLKAIRLVEGVHNVQVVYEGQVVTERLEVIPSTTIRYRPRFEEE